MHMECIKVKIGKPWYTLLFDCASFSLVTKSSLKINKLYKKENHNSAIKKRLKTGNRNPIIKEAENRELTLDLKRIPLLEVNICTKPVSALV